MFCFGGFLEQHFDYFFYPQDISLGQEEEEEDHHHHFIYKSRTYTFQKYQLDRSHKNRRPLFSTPFAWTTLLDNLSNFLCCVTKRLPRIIIFYPDSGLDQFGSHANVCGCCFWMVAGWLVASRLSLVRLLMRTTMWVLKKILRVLFFCPSSSSRDHHDHDHLATTTMTTMPNRDPGQRHWYQRRRSLLLI